MKFSYDILDALFELINVQSVNDNISGKVYSTEIPNGDLQENISLNVLTNKSNYYQVGYINLNIYLKELLSGRPNLKRFREIVEIIRPLIDDVKKGTYTFQIYEDKGIFKDQENDGLYFYNLRLKFQTI